VALQYHDAHLLCAGKSYTPSDGGGNVTSENHHGGFPYQFLSRHVERQNQRQSKEGSPPGVSLLTLIEIRTTRSGSYIINLLLIKMEMNSFRGYKTRVWLDILQ
jgi:hypothetical protein